MEPPNGACVLDTPVAARPAASAPPDFSDSAPHCVAATRVVPLANMPGRNKNAHDRNGHKRQKTHGIAGTSVNVQVDLVPGARAFRYRVQPIHRVFALDFAAILGHLQDDLPVTSTCRRSEGLGATYSESFTLLMGQRECRFIGSKLEGSIGRRSRTCLRVCSGRGR